MMALVGLSVVGCDQLSKEVAKTNMQQSQTVQLPAGAEFELRAVENPGGLLSFGSELPDPLRRAIFRWGVPGVLIISLIPLALGASRGQMLGMGLILGGGIGNWLDRLGSDAAVTDFMRIGIGKLSTGIFNLADVALLAGVALVFVAQSRTENGPLRESKDPLPADQQGENP